MEEVHPFCADGPIFPPRLLATGSRLMCLWSCDQAASRRRLPTERIVLQVSQGKALQYQLISRSGGVSSCFWGPGQVDFPQPALDVSYVAPQEAGSPEAHRYQELDPDLQRKLETICSRASNFGYEPGPDPALVLQQQQPCLTSCLCPG